MMANQEKAKHTPSEWHYEYGPRWDESEAGNYAAIMGPDNHGFAHAFVVDDYKQGGSIEHNARLIAAAPELLDACILAKQYYGSDDKGALFYMELTKKLDKAIKYATENQLEGDL